MISINFDRIFMLVSYGLSEPATWELLVAPSIEMLFPFCGQAD